MFQQLFLPYRKLFLRLLFSVFTARESDSKGPLQELSTGFGNGPFTLGQFCQSPGVVRLVTFLASDLSISISCFQAKQWICGILLTAAEEERLAVKSHLIKKRSPQDKGEVVLTNKSTNLHPVLKKDRYMLCAAGTSHASAPDALAAGV